MTFWPRRLREPRLFAVLALAALAAGLTLVGSAESESSDYAPVFATTALDGWDPPWRTVAATESAEDSTACMEMPSKWLVVGWDSADWRLVLPLLERGEMPHLAALMQNGVYGNLASFVPTLSPALWTTVATGLPPDEHGIRHFYNQQPPVDRWMSRLKNLGRLERHLYSNADRKAPAIWNELTAHRRDVMIVGYHNTFPVEQVGGLMVSNYLTQDTVGAMMDIDADLGGKGGFASGLVYPPERLDEVLAIQQRVRQRVPEAVQRFASFNSERSLRRFLERSRELDPDGNQRPYFLSHAWQYDQVVAEVAAELYPEFDPDLAMIHFQSLDWAAHHFLYFDRPHRFERFDWDEEVRRELEAKLPRYRDTVDTFYRYMDGWLGRLVEMAGSETTVLVLSDHGTGPGPDPDLPGYHDDAPPGILVASGPGIRSDGRGVDGATLYDIMPTLMRGLDLPVATDLPGRVLTEAFCSETLRSTPRATVASYASESFVPPISRPADLDETVLLQLESLGYLD